LANNEPPELSAKAKADLARKAIEPATKEERLAQIETCRNMWKRLLKHSEAIKPPDGYTAKVFRIAASVFLLGAEHLGDQLSKELGDDKGERGKHA
jgi:hypothetical protein